MKETKSGTDILSSWSTNGNGQSTLRNQSSQKINHIRKNYSDARLQSYLLEEVSRTFALTIPALPQELSRVVSNAYLLCRIVDTVEDEPNLSPSEKKRYCSRFINVVTASESAESFALDLLPLLSDETKAGEFELILLTDRVINITHQFDTLQQKALQGCVQNMAEGMAYYQQSASGQGLQNLEDLNNYCYYVAGVVGEMLTELFCLYSPDINEHKNKMMNLAVSFGQGLQMTNILKDIWEDYERSACWLPRDHFRDDLQSLQDGKSTKEFRDGLETLIGVAHGHLKQAMEYVLHIPTGEKGIRRFCYWAIGMAILTLQKIHKNPGFTSADEVKISRKSVKATILLTNMTVGSNHLLKILFNIMRRKLPVQKI